jgi:hypothetical protein
MSEQKVLEPERIRAYLTTHGWTPENCPPEEGVIFTYSELSDEGEPMTLIVPGSSNVIFFPLRVNDIIVSVAGIEERSQDAVLADIWATPLPQASPASTRTQPPPDSSTPETTRKGA